MGPRQKETSEKKSETTTYASSVARELAYTRGNQTTQEKWLSKSQQVINTLLDKLKKNQFESFNEIVSWVGQQRCLIAIELGQGKFIWGERSEQQYDQLKDRIFTTVSESQNWYDTPDFKYNDELDGPLLYGKPRGITHAVLGQKETVIEGQDLWVALRQQHTLFTSLEKLARGPYENNSLSTDNFTCEKLKKNDETLYKMKVSFPETAESATFPHSPDVLKIKFKIDSKGKKVTFYHPEVSLDEQLGNLKVLDGYWQALKDWNSTQDINVFFENMAKLAHLSACLPFYERGTSSAVEWLMRTISFSKGIYLGPFTAGMGWDFKAFYTPDRDAYSKWLRNAFKSILFFDVNLPENAVFSYSIPLKSVPACFSELMVSNNDDKLETSLSVHLTEDQIIEETSPDFLALLRYSANGETDKVRELLQKNSALIQMRTGEKGITPLSIAAEHGRVEVVRALMIQQWKTEDIVSALHAAILSDNAVIFGLLFKSPVIKPNKEVFFQEAFRRDSKEIINLLIELGVNINSAILDTPSPQTPLEAAINSNRSDMIELLLNKNADVNLMVTYKKAICSYIFLIAINQNQKALELLLEKHPANINTKIIFKPSFLIMPLIQNKKMKLVDAFMKFIDAGNGSYDNPFPLTAIDVVIILGNTNMIKMLIAAGSFIGNQQIQLAQFLGNEHIQKLIEESAAEQKTQPADKKENRVKITDSSSVTIHASSPSVLFPAKENTIILVDITDFKSNIASAFKIYKGSSRRIENIKKFIPSSSTVSQETLHQLLISINNELNRKTITGVNKKLRNLLNPYLAGMLDNLVIKDDKLAREFGYVRTKRSISR